MPLLSDEDKRNYLGPVLDLHCRTCGEQYIRHYCRSCDEFFTTCACGESGSMRDSHYRHRVDRGDGQGPKMEPKEKPMDDAEALAAKLGFGYDAFEAALREAEVIDIEACARILANPLPIERYKEMAKVGLTLIHLELQRRVDASP